jgi:exodeoxyribonuclease V alpha subunit
LVVVVGQPRALAIAVRNDRVTRRYGLLAERLRSAAERRAILAGG